MSQNPVFISSEWLSDYFWRSANFTVQRRIGKRCCSVALFGNMLQ